MNQKHFSNSNRNVDPKLYNSKRWKELREAILNETPFCLNCESTFKLHIDHIWEHNNLPELFYLKENLRPLCASCHNTKTFFDKWILSQNQNEITLNVVDEICDNNIVKMESDKALKIKVLVQNVVSSDLFNEYIFKIKQLTLFEIHEVIFEICRRLKSTFKIIKFNDKEFKSIPEFANELLKRKSIILT